ncbi:MAG: hypothetical protein ACK53Y_15525, partial [bacterium]
MVTGRYNFQSTPERLQHGNRSILFGGLSSGSASAGSVSSGGQSSGNGSSVIATSSISRGGA